VACCIRWKPTRKGLISGTIMGSFGAAPSIFGYIMVRLINPNQINPSSNGMFEDIDLLNKIPRALRVISII
jgi:hypothetical protein